MQLTLIRPRHAARRGRRARAAGRSPARPRRARAPPCRTRPTRGASRLVTSCREPAERWSWSALDAVLVTHLHGDHLDDTARAAAIQARRRCSASRRDAERLRAEGCTHVRPVDGRRARSPTASSSCPPAAAHGMRPDGSAARWTSTGTDPFTARRRTSPTAREPAGLGTILYDLGTRCSLARHAPATATSWTPACGSSSPSSSPDRTTRTTRSTSTSAARPGELAARRAADRPCDASIATLGWLSLVDDPPRPTAARSTGGLIDQQGRRKPAVRAFRRG